MENTKPRARSEAPSTARAMGTIAVIGLGVLLWSRSVRRRRTQPSLTPRALHDLVEESLNLLGAVRGYCELAKVKGESGCALASRMDSSIATVDETTALLRRLLAACRRQAL